MPDMRLDYLVPDVDLFTEVDAYGATSAKHVCFRYYKERPCSAVLYFVEEQTYWEFDRALIYAALSNGGAGIGYVRIAVPVGEGKDVVRFWIMPPNGMATFTVPYVFVRDYIDLTMRIVHPGHEDLGVDGALEEMFGIHRSQSWWRQVCECASCKTRRMNKEKGNT